MKTLEHPILPRVREALADLEPARRDVRVLVGTDEHIPHERRVALTPRHVRELSDVLVSAGLEPRIGVVSGAGVRAGRGGSDGFPDAEYRAAGAEVVTESDLAAGPPWDVVHALKEPTPYEASIPGPFLRIGALHLASRPASLRPILGQRNFAAILDGGTVGSCSWLVHGGDRTPIVASMSRFAGSVAGRHLVAALRDAGLSGRVIVVGGGVAGRAALRRIAPHADEVVVVDPFAPTREVLASLLPRLGCEEFHLVPELLDEHFDGAAGVLFAHRSGAKAAEKVCHVDQIRRMHPGAAIADIAIDQGGSIAHPDYDERDDAHAAREKYRAVLDGYSYYAETNMPREEPREASETHGDSSLPYLAVLAALVAVDGSATATTRRLLDIPQRICRRREDVRDAELLACLQQDLRNGLQLAVVDGDLEITDEDVRSDGGLSDWVRATAAVA